MSQKLRAGIFIMMAVFAVIALFLMIFPETGSSSDETYVHILEENDVETTQSLSEEGTVSESESGQSNDTICVYVCGKVKHPGIYELAPDSRWYDFIKAAGGFSKKAAKEYLNLATKAEDGEQIYVPSKKEVAAMKKTASTQVSENADGQGRQTASSEEKKVNINTAGKEELMTLPGIGEAKADAILSYRESKGVFSSTEELMQISGIKEGIYQKIMDYITI